MAEKSSVFDMIGPVMIGPSSSHTAGVVRIAKAAIRVLGAPPEEVAFAHAAERRLKHMFKAIGNASTLCIDAGDVKGSIAFIAPVLAHEECNIATMNVSRKGRHEQAWQFFKMGSGIKLFTLELPAAA